jgi:hypothetical protein
LILDLQLLWGGGEGVLARMREDADIPLTPVVLVSTTATTDYLAPVVGCLTKPFRLKALVEQVTAAALKARQAPA